MKRTPVKRIRAHLAYVEAELLRHDLTPEMRMRREYQRDVYRRELAGRCSRCGRELRDPISRARGLGPECAWKGAA